MSREHEAGRHMRTRSLSLPGEAENLQDSDPHSQVQPQEDDIEMTNGSSTTHSVPAPTKPSCSREEEPRSSTTRPIDGLPPDPPITKHTLSELDATKIIHNSKLRHDINFDPELHFRPNLEGDRGKKKQERSNSFWKTLEKQLCMFVDPSKRPEFLKLYGQSDEWCLPVLLKTVKEILETLVPGKDRALLDESLNVKHKMQEFYKGALDLDKMAVWLSKVLKSHCAPMRDEEVDRMASSVKAGNSSNDLHKLVDGLKELLTVLEHMKLDVANHHIRLLRPVLIQDTVQFEQRFFDKKINSRRISVDSSRDWYREAMLTYGSEHPGSFGAMNVFFEAFSRLILPSHDKSIPETFRQHDHERIMKFRGEALEGINLDICMRLYYNLERVANTQAQLNTSYLEEPSRHSSSSFDSNPLTSSRPSSLVFSDSSSSPRSSIDAIPAYVANDTYESKAKARNLYNSLLALLYSSGHPTNPIARWQSVTSAMAVQIFRNLKNAPSEQLQSIEDELVASISRYESNKFQEAEQAFHQRLSEELSHKVAEFRGLSGVSLYTTVSQRKATFTGYAKEIYQSLRDGEDLAFDDLATRLAHVGILHWRVWADLAYVNRETRGASRCGSETSSESSEDSSDSLTS